MAIVVNQASTSANSPANSSGDPPRKVVTRVLQVCEQEGVEASVALRRLRRSTTRGWVRDLMQRYGRRGGGEIAEDAAARDDEDTVHVDEAPLRLLERLESLLASVLHSSRVSNRWRRRLVWEVYVGGMLDGVHLQRSEVVAAVRGLGVPKRKATDGQLLADLDVISRALKSLRTQ